MLRPVSARDAVFTSHLLHHVEDKLQLLKECYRILSPEGVYMNRHVPREDLDTPDHVFFPEAYEIDKKRYATKKQIEDWLRLVGFNKVTSETISQQSQRPEERYRTISSARDCQYKVAGLQGANITFIDGLFYLCEILYSLT